MLVLKKKLKTSEQISNKIEQEKTKSKIKDSIHCWSRKALEFMLLIMLHWLSKENARDSFKSLNLIIRYNVKMIKIFWEEINVKINSRRSR